MATDAAVGSLTELHAIQALLAETVAAERALDAELEGLLAKRAVRCGVKGCAQVKSGPRACAHTRGRRAQRLAPNAWPCAAYSTPPSQRCAAACTQPSTKRCSCVRNPDARRFRAPPQELADSLGGLDAARELLEVVTADAEHVAATVAGTCSLAERISGKVRRRGARCAPCAPPGLLPSRTMLLR
jgi:hypothetical protein